MSYRRVLTGEGLIMLVSRNVRRLRAISGLTATEAARRAGMSRRTWLRIEAGESNMELKSVAKIVVGLGVDAEELFREAPKKD